MASSLVILLTLVSLASASHHYGGTVSFAYKGRNPDGTLMVDIHNRATFTTCQYPQSTVCYSGNCGSLRTSQRVVLDSGTNGPVSSGQWCETEQIEKRVLYTDKPFQMRSASCCWVTTRNGVNDWRLSTFVDLGKRSDTGEPNRSPDTAILPLLRVPQNCPRSYKLMDFDPDGDRVRCRYGNDPNLECSSCHLPSGFQLDENSCTLHYDNSTSADSRVFGLEMVVEDFPRQHITLQYTDGTSATRFPPLARRKREATITWPITTTVAPWMTTAMTPRPTTTTTTAPTTTSTSYHGTPLSRLSLQFSFLVDPSVPSCEEGLYLPKFLDPTPRNGARLEAEVNKELEIRIKAQASYSTLQNIIMSGPANLAKHKTTHDEFVIRWTPVTDGLNDHYAICFAVESTSGSRVYQSEMRCVVVSVVKEHVKVDVICTEFNMTVIVDKSTFSGLDEDHLRLSESNNVDCNLSTRSNSTHIIGTFPLNACGTQIEEDETNLMFKNLITTYDNSSRLITRHHQLEVQFYCSYPKTGNVTAGFTAHRKNVTVWEKGFGKFTYQFEFYDDQTYLRMKDENTYPLEYDIGSRIYMEIDATSSVNNTVMFVESCSAAPYDIPNYQNTYSIIENGCNVDPTIQIHSPDKPTQFRFSLEAFKFIGLHDQVYISCSLMMCEAGNSNTRCSKGCIRSTQANNRRKREATIESTKHFVSQGPLRLRRSAESSGHEVVNLNLNLAFMAGCLLAAVGMVCGVVVYKTKISKVKYQPLSTIES
ncbi:uncharacterized protein LOC125005226 [Mugil cephalus]|uniref:uncharacterized protein LOC125005226 n=1 Tax=Mugil cephalus TaxID=48193 RepID=UPI001FB78AD1|nr:uncharacterized protein LOC125005226 [Mugil cephalus]